MKHLIAWERGLKRDDRKRDMDALLADKERADAECDKYKSMVERLIEEIDKHTGGYPVAGKEWYGMGKLHTLADAWKEQKK